MRRIVVVGAGLAGLTAARELLRSGGCAVTVIEAQPRPGGLAITVDRQGCRMDLGPHRWHTEMPEAHAVFESLPAGLRIEAVRRSRMLLGGRLLRYPPSLMELARRMPWRALGMAAGLLAARGAHPATSGAAPSDCAAALRSLYGRPIYDLLFGPYMGKVWKTPPEQLDAEIVRLRILPHRNRLARVARPRSNRRLQYLRGGIEALPRRLAADVERAGGRIICGAQAVALEGEAGAVRAVVCQTASEGAKRFEADAVLSTAPITNLAQMLAPLGMAPQAVESARSLEFLRLILVNLMIARDRAMPDSWIYFPEASIRINRAHEPKNFDPSMGPPGRSILAAEITCRGADAHWRAGDADLIATATRDFQTAGLIRAGDVADGFVVRLETAYPLYQIGFRSRLATVLEAVGRFGNVVTFGRQGLFNHNNMDHSIVMGLRAAQAAASRTPATAMRAFDAEFQRFRIVD